MPLPFWPIAAQRAAHARGFLEILRGQEMTSLRDGADFDQVR
jgi:hypothetical protein